MQIQGCDFPVKKKIKITSKIERNRQGYCVNRAEKKRIAERQAEKEKRLSAIGMDWLTSNERAWNRGYSKAKDYYDRYGNLNVKVGYICPDGYPLGEWLHSQRSHGKGLES